jgi:acetyl esterase/lipase
MKSVLIVLFGSALTAQAQDRPLEPIAAKLEPTRTVVYKTVGNRSLKLHVFEPDGHDKADQRPGYLTIHGGGWTGRTPRYFYPFAKHFADLGMLSISLEYRLRSPKLGTTVFDCVKDGRSAIRYLRSHANELGIDPDKIAVSGGSAGGHIAAGTALFDTVNEESDDLTVSCLPNLLILCYPVIDTSKDGYGQAKIGERWRELSPVEHVKPSLPATLLLHGTADTVTPFAGARLFHKRMIQAGNTCDFIAFEGGRHGYFIFDLDLFAEAMMQTETFLKQHHFLPVSSSLER